ncbi:uncharacterized protein LOC133819184 [Humulus lupulus]|uniref:uncharacterized protein LOC133819184 n=1 Tax=Humulus lupulus TaxID=3486 RepID=UPI002B402044|nr:uncharacterized protein LOC133819184 [Humulus lupulus]
MNFKLLLLLVSYVLIITTTTNASSSSSPTSNFYPKLPRLSPIIGNRFFLRHLNHQSSLAVSNIPPNYKLFLYNQTLDHFNYQPESYTTFQQRYYVNSKYWGGSNANAPIFAYLGAESPIDGDIPYIGSLVENASSFKALIVFIEHRYYGKSIPYGSWMAVKKNTSRLGYFHSAQAIADYAEILLYIKKTYQAPKSPIIVIGGSYGGMLASWFRLKYPHIALGALASSAPILYFDDITPQTAYFQIASNNFREASDSCYQTIKQSWSEIDRVAAMANGLSILSNKFNTCSPLQRSSELSSYLNLIYLTASQYNSPPTYQVSVICNGIDDNKSGDILDKIFSGISAYDPRANCYVNSPIPPADADTNEAWSWQTCSDMVFPIGVGNDTMFPATPFDLTYLINYCKRRYGVPPRPDWATTYYGGHNIKLDLYRFGSNIIFTNGLKDPYSAGGVLEDINKSIFALKTTNGSHCLDLVPENTATDPNWLVQQRQTSARIVKNWIDQYNADLKTFKI